MEADALDLRPNDAEIPRSHPQSLRSVERELLADQFPKKNGGPIMEPPL